jgi:type IV fimbrial biogenesis protein FimT
MHSPPSFTAPPEALIPTQGRIRNAQGPTLNARAASRRSRPAVTLAIAAILLASAAPDWHRLIERQRLSLIASQWAGDLQSTRSESVLRNQILRMNVHDGAWGSCYVVHCGPRDQCHCDTPPAGIAECGGAARLLKRVVLASPDGLRLQSNTGSIAFDPLHGTATPTAPLHVIAASHSGFAEARQTVSFRRADAVRREAVPMSATPEQFGVNGWTEPGERFVAYRCLAPAAGDPPVWSGRSNLVLMGWATGDSTFARRVCRFVNDINGNDVIDRDEEYPADYRRVDRGLEQQNFLVIRGVQRFLASATTTLSGDSATAAGTLAATEPHQP